MPDVILKDGSRVRFVFEFDAESKNVVLKVGLPGEAAHDFSMSLIQALGGCCDCPLPPHSVAYKRESRKICEAMGTHLRTIAEYYFIRAEELRAAVQAEELKNVIL